MKAQGRVGIEKRNPNPGTITPISQHQRGGSDPARKRMGTDVARILQKLGLRDRVQRHLRL